MLKLEDRTFEDLQHVARMQLNQSQSFFHDFALHFIKHFFATHANGERLGRVNPKWLLGDSGQEVGLAFSCVFVIQSLEFGELQNLFH